MSFMKKIFSIFATTAVALMTIFACTKVDELENKTNPFPVPGSSEQASGAEVVELQGLDVTPKTNYVTVGEIVELSLSCTPENATVGNVTWTSSDETVATVDANGKVTTLAKGIVRITAAASGQSVTALVNVFADPIPATGIKVNKTEINLLAGRATKVKATLLPDGTGEGGAATTDKQAFVWSSSDEKVATVIAGFVQAWAVGEATITVSQGDLSAQIKVTVADKIKLIDRSEAWPFTVTPKWDKDWYGKVTGSHVDVGMTGFDGEYAYFKVVAADAFEGIEAVSNNVYEQVSERQDEGKDPKSLFTSGESQTANYSDKGNAVAYVLAYDESYEFTGEYAMLAFEAVEPEPVHATGIQFTQGWNDTPISEITLKEGKSLNYFSAKLLPDDCTDIGEISFSSSDQSVVVLNPYYSSYYTVTAVAPGEADIIARFNDLEASIHVTVTGSDIKWTDKSGDWTGTWGMGLYYGYYECFGFTLNTCSASQHYIAIVNASDISGDPYANYKTVASQNESSLQWGASSSLPDFSAYSWNDKDDTIERYAYVFGVSSGDYTGEYAIFHYDPNGGGEDPDEPVDPVEGKRIKFGDVVFRAEIPASRATSDEGSLEAWVYVTSTGGCQNIAGAESNFLLRIDGGQLDYVYGGAIDDRGEVAEAHVRASIGTNEWHHVVATYTQNDKAILYVDGDQVGSANTQDHPVYMDGKTKNDGTYPCWGYPFRFYIGSGSDKHNYSGSVAYVRVYDRAIGADEISGLMYKENVDDSALIAYWKFNEGSGNQITDHSGNGVTLNAKQALTGGASGSEPTLADGTVTWEDGTLPY